MKHLRLSIKFVQNLNRMRHFINLKDIPAKDLRKVLIDAKKRKIARKKLTMKIIYG